MRPSSAKTFGRWPELEAAERTRAASAPPPPPADEDDDDEEEAAAAPAPKAAPLRARARGRRPNASRETVEKVLAWWRARRELGTARELAEREGLSVRQIWRIVDQELNHGGYRHYRSNDP